MIATPDTFRDTLEDLGNSLGLTDPISGPVVLSLNKARRTAVDIAIRCAECPGEGPQRPFAIALRTALKDPMVRRLSDTKGVAFLSRG